MASNIFTPASINPQSRATPTVSKSSSFSSSADYFRPSLINQQSRQIRVIHKEKKKKPEPYVVIPSASKPMPQTQRDIFTKRYDKSASQIGKTMLNDSNKLASHITKPLLNPSIKGIDVWLNMTQTPSYQKAKKFTTLPSPIPHLSFRDIATEIFPRVMKGAIKKARDKPVTVIAEYYGGKLIGTGLGLGGNIWKGATATARVGGIASRSAVKGIEMGTKTVMAGSTLAWGGSELSKIASSETPFETLGSRAVSDIAFFGGMKSGSQSSMVKEASKWSAKKQIQSTTKWSGLLTEQTIKTPKSQSLIKAKTKGLEGTFKINKKEYPFTSQVDIMGRSYPNKQSTYLMKTRTTTPKTRTTTRYDLNLVKQDLSMPKIKKITSVYKQNIKGKIHKTKLIPKVSKPNIFLKQPKKSDLVIIPQTRTKYKTISPKLLSKDLIITTTTAKKGKFDFSKVTTSILNRKSILHLKTKGLTKEISLFKSTPYKSKVNLLSGRSKSASLISQEQMANIKSTYPTGATSTTKVSKIKSLEFSTRINKPKTGGTFKSIKLKTKDIFKSIMDTNKQMWGSKRGKVTYSSVSRFKPKVKGRTPKIDSAFPSLIDTSIKGSLISHIPEIKLSTYIVAFPTFKKPTKSKSNLVSQFNFNSMGIKESESSDYFKPFKYGQSIQQKQKERQKPREIIKPAYKPTYPIYKQKIESLITPIKDVIPEQKQDVAFMSSYKSPTPPPTPKSYNPEFAFPSLLNLGGGGSSGRRKKKSSSSKFKFEYSPSVMALAHNIKGKAPKLKGSGLAIRPIIIKGLK